MSGRIMLGPLAPLADCPSVTDIMVTPDGTVWVDAGDGVQRAATPFALEGPPVVRELAVRLCAQLGCRLDDAAPIADASTADGLRLHAVLEPLVPEGACISIRLPAARHMSLDALAAQGLCPEPWVDGLRRMVRARRNLLIAGSTGSGKTTLLKALLAECAPSDRIVAVEEVRELDGVPHPHVVSLAARNANAEGAGAVSLADLVKATLRMRPDRIIVGECRGEEVADLLRALNTGHRGAMTTLHANGVEQVPARLLGLGLLAGLPLQSLTMLAAQAFDAVVFVQRQGRRRFIGQIGTIDVCDGRLTGTVCARWDGRTL